MGDKNGGEIFRGAADTCEALANLQRRKPGVYEDADLGGLDIGAIAAGAAAEDGEFDGHGVTYRPKSLRANFFGHKYF